MQTKRTVTVLVLIFEEELMKTIPINRSANEIVVKEITSTSRAVAAAGDAVPVEVQPTFTIAFTLGTRMKDLHDTIIRTVLQQTRGNRLRAAQLLHINPRTIRRRLGKKEMIGSVIRAA
jgi:DNA-binding NtrC family response regulator